MSFFKGLGLSAKITAVVVASIVVLVAVNSIVFIRGYARDVEQDLISKASSFTALADETKNHVSKLHHDKVFDVQTMLAEVNQTVTSGGDYKTTRFFNTIPVVAGWTAAGDAARRENLDFKVPAFDARNKENTPEPGSFREALLRDLTSQVKAGGKDSLGRIDTKTNKLHYMRAIKLDDSCMMCHGDPAKYDQRDEKGNYDGKDILGFAMESWKPGDVHGAFEVIMPLDPLDAQVAGFMGNSLMITVPLAVVSIGSLIYLLRTLLSRPLNNLVEMVKEIASGEGDLTKRLKLQRGDEIGRLGHWFDEFLSSLHKIISDVSGSTRQVAAAATEIAASSEQMAAGISRQQQQASQVSAAVEEMAATVTEVAKKSGEAAQAASDSQKDANTGGDVVRQTVTEIKAIAEDVMSSAAAVAGLGKKGEQIGAIIEVIDDIADQTNLLALNAAIEAARAGEHGRGFAVVADEVRKLAERTQQATEEVSRSIREIQEETKSAVVRIEAGSKRVNHGVELAGNAGNSLERIVNSSQTVGSMVTSIAAAAEEQSAASEQIARSIEQINAVTRESAEGANQAAKAAGDLSAQAEKLQSLVSRFKL